MATFMRMGTAKMRRLKGHGCVSMWVMYMWVLSRVERKGCRLGGGRLNGAGGGLGAVGLTAEAALGFGALLDVPFAICFQVAG